MNKGAGRWLVAVASGKGGVGKTSLTLNLAALAARQGQRVLLFDGDTGLANADVQLNVQPVADLAMVLHGNASLRAIVTPVPTLSSPGTVRRPPLMRTVPWERAVGRPAWPTWNMLERMKPLLMVRTATLLRPTRVYMVG